MVKHNCSREDAGRQAGGQRDGQGDGGEWEKGWGIGRQAGGQRDGQGDGGEWEKGWGIGRQAGGQRDGQGDGGEWEKGWGIGRQAGGQRDGQGDGGEWEKGVEGRRGRGQKTDRRTYRRTIRQIFPCNRNKVRRQLIKYGASETVMRSHSPILSSRSSSGRMSCAASGHGTWCAPRCRVELR